MSSLCKAPGCAAQMVLDNRQYAGVEGSWSDLFQSFKWDIVKSVLKSMTGMQGSKVKASVTPVYSQSCHKPSHHATAPGLPARLQARLASPDASCPRTTAAHDVPCPRTTCARDAPRPHHLSP